MTAKTRLVDAVRAVVDPVTGGIEFSVNGQAYQVSGPKLTNVHGKYPNGYISSGTSNSSAPGWTHTFRVSADRSFDQIRIGLINLEATEMTGVTALVASTETAANRINPIKSGAQDNSIHAAGTGTGWVQVTFSGASSVTLPARVSATQPSITFSDWMQLKSFTRADGGTFPLAMVRFFNPSANATQTVSEGISTGADALTPELWWQSRQNVDGVTTPANFTSTSEGTSPNWPIIEFMSAEVGTLLYGAGDSILAGYSLTYKQSNWLAQTSLGLRNAGVNCSCVNDGWVGQTSAQYYARAAAAIPLVLPKIAVYAPYSSNDGTPTQAIVDTSFFQAVKFINLCLTNGVLPVLTTPVPNGDLSTAQDILRMQLVNRLNALTSVIVIDFNSVLGASNGDGSYSWIPALSYNTRHPNQAGHDAMTEVAIPKIAKAINSL